MLAPLGSATPWIAAVSAPQPVHNHTAVITATIYDDGSLQEVWAEIYSPSYQVLDDTDSVNIIDVPHVPLSPVCSDCTAVPKEPNLYTGSYDEFTEDGVYRVVIHTRDDDGNHAVPYVTTVGQLPPAIVKSVAPQGQVNYGDELTYTLVVSAVPGASVTLYDPLEGMTFAHFVAQPSGVSYSDGVISGTTTVTPTSQITVSFVTRVDVPGTVGWTVDVNNRACVYLFGGTLGGCKWSNEVTNSVFRPYKVYLPLAVQKSAP